MTGDRFARLVNLIFTRDMVPVSFLYIVFALHLVSKNVMFFRIKNLFASPRQDISIGQC